MEKLSLEEMKDIEYDILCDVADLCEKYGLRYGLSYGTLLGAVRHGGFIPWDDDVDIIMPRPDYEKFLKIAGELPDRLKASSPVSDENNFNTYAKVYDLRTKLIECPEGKRIPIHVYLDIFPIDGLPEDTLKMEKHRRRCRKLMLILYAFRAAKFKVNETKGLQRGLWKLLSLVQRKFIKNKQINYLNRVALKYDFDKSHYCGIVVAGYGYREMMPSHIFQFDRKVAFRDREFYTLRFTEYYLTQIYGDYMKLPPVEERIAHDNEAYRIC